MKEVDHYYQELLVIIIAQHSACLLHRSMSFSDEKIMRRALMKREKHHDKFI